MPTGMDPTLEGLHISFSRRDLYVQLQNSGPRGPERSSSPRPVRPRLGQGWGSCRTDSDSLGQM